jgi:two-component system nitrogen regulation sensor histidine kinase NtrY
VDEFSRFAQLPEASPDMADLNKIIDGIVKMYDGIKPGVGIKTDYDPAIGMIRLDKEQIHRVFRNVIENAMDAVGENGTIEIVTKLDAAKNRVLIDIMDDGHGIDANNLGKIFMPYFSTKEKGSGLGLAIVNRIIADHDGSITAKSRVPRGTIMSIDLPA